MKRNETKPIQATINQIHGQINKKPTNKMEEKRKNELDSRKAKASEKEEKEKSGNWKAKR